MATSKSKGKAKGRPKRKAPPTNAELKKQLAAAKRKCTGLERNVGRLRTANEAAESKSAELHEKLAELQIAPNSTSPGGNVQRNNFNNGLHNFGSQGANVNGCHGWVFGYGCNDLAQSRSMEQMLARVAHKESKKLKPGRRKRPRATSPHESTSALSSTSALHSPSAFSGSSAPSPPSAFSNLAAFSTSSGPQVGGASESRSKARRVSTRSPSTSSRPTPSRKRPRRTTARSQNSVSPHDECNFPSFERRSQSASHEEVTPAEARYLQEETAVIPEDHEQQEAAAADGDHGVAKGDHKANQTSATEERDFGVSHIDNGGVQHQRAVGERREFALEHSRQLDADGQEAGGAAAQSNHKADEKSVVERCDVGGDAAEDIRESSRQPAVKPCEDGGVTCEDGHEAAEESVVARRGDSGDVGDAIVEDREHSGSGAFNAGHMQPHGESVAKLCEHSAGGESTAKRGDVSGEPAAGRRTSDEAAAKDRASHAKAAGDSAGSKDSTPKHRDAAVEAAEDHLSHAQAGCESASELQEASKESAAERGEAAAGAADEDGEAADEDGEPHGRESVADGEEKCEYDQSDEYAKVGRNDLDPQYDKDETDVYVRFTRVERDVDTGDVYRESCKYVLCNAEELDGVDEDGVDKNDADEDGVDEEGLPSADQTSAKACRCRIPFKDDLITQRTYKRCACPTPTFTESGLYDIPSVPHSSKSCLQNDGDRHRPRKEVRFAEDLTSGPSLPFRKPCSGYACCGDTNSRAFDEEETKEATPELLIPRWTAISRNTDGRHGDIVREHIEHIGVGSRVDLHVGGAAKYVAATVTACDVATRVVTVRYETAEAEGKSETLSIDSPRVWQHDTYTKCSCATPTSPQGDWHYDGEPEESFEENQSVDDGDVDSDDPPPRTTVTTQSWENACHESESDEEDVSGSDVDSALAGSGSDVEEENDEDDQMSPQRDNGEDRHAVAKRFAVFAVAAAYKRRKGRHAVAKRSAVFAVVTAVTVSVAEGEKRKFLRRTR